MVRTVLRPSRRKGEILDRTFAHPTKPGRDDHEIVIPISERDIDFDMDQSYIMPILPRLSALRRPSSGGGKEDKTWAQERAAGTKKRRLRCLTL
jgi:hypothetical protein